MKRRTLTASNRGLTASNAPTREREPAVWPTAEEYLRIRSFVMASPEGRKLVRWVQTVQPPSDPDEFAFIAIQAIIAASFNAHTAARIFDDTVKPALLEDRPIFPLFSHPGKAEAIEQWWHHRLGWFEEFRTLRHPEETIAWLHTKPYMGPALKLQIARDLGVADVAKPDIWLTRIAGRAGETVQGLCERLARETGESVGEVDLVLWYAAANGMIED